MRVLIVSQNDELVSKIEPYLKELGHNIDICKSVTDARQMYSGRNYELVISDLELEDGLGINLINEMKRKSSNTSCIILSNKSDKGTEISAFKKGVDDFIVIPCDFGILTARLEAKLRFSGTNVIEVDDLVIDPDEEKIIYQGNEVDLKGKPFEVLTHLAKHKKQIVSKEQLLDAIWEEPELVTPNVIEVAINQIRQKMDKPLNIATIETVRRKGYRFCYPHKSNDPDVI